MAIGELLVNGLLIFLLILINGFFAAAEMAIITARKGRLNEMIAQGKSAAETVKNLKADPDRFLATIQVGITLVATLASAIGGVAAIEFLKPFFDTLPWEVARKLAEVLSLAIVVIIITYLSLVFGELIPKSLALRYAEQIACAVAHPINTLSRYASFFIRVLTASCNTFLKFMGLGGLESRPFAAREEMISLIEEGMERGVIGKTERELIHGVFEFTDATVREVMVPKVKVDAVDVGTPAEQVLSFIEESGFSRFPVYDGDLNNIVGVLYNKDVLRVLAQKKILDLRKLLRKPFFVPETILVSRLLRELQRRRTHIAVVVNEHGDTVGIVTIEDLMEEIVGEIEDEYDLGEKGPVERTRDGSYLIDGAVSLRDLVDREFPFELEADEYDSLGGFMMAKLQRIPVGGETAIHQGYRLTVVDMDGRRIAKIKMERLPEKKRKEA
ncbi:MAG: hemolysin family protein [Nitrospirota bacterium]|nr:hemolysin family protein [Nitrospirota bacterium]